MSFPGFQFWVSIQCTSSTRNNSAYEIFDDLLCMFFSPRAKQVTFIIPVSAEIPVCEV